jgi:predicted permease
LALFAATLHALAPLFGLILLGYLLKRLRVLHVSHAPVLNGLVVNATLPALVIHSLLAAPAIPPRSVLLPVDLLVTEILLCLGVAALGRALRWPETLSGAAILVASYGNTGFLGYPITLALMPAQFTSAVLLDQFGMSMGLIVTAALAGALYKGAKADPRATIKRIFSSPILASAIIAILLRQVRVPAVLAHAPAAVAVGSAIDSCLVYLGQGTTPLVLLALGVSLRPGTVARSIRPLLVSTTAKLILSPLLMLLFCHWSHFPHPQMVLAIMMAAMPTAVLASVLSGQYDLDGEYAVATVFVTTVLSAVTVPLWLALVR